MVSITFADMKSPSKWQTRVRGQKRPFTPLFQVLFPCLHDSGQAIVLKSQISHYLSWLVVSTPLKNISQLGWLFPIYGKIILMFQTTNQTIFHDSPEIHHHFRGNESPSHPGFPDGHPSSIGPIVKHTRTSDWWWIISLFKHPHV